MSENQAAKRTRFLEIGDATATSTIAAPVRKIEVDDRHLAVLKTIYPLKQSSDKAIEVKFKDRVNELAGHIGSKEIENIGDSIKITGVNEHPIYRVFVSTLYEKRILLRDAKPYDGEPVGATLIHSEKQVNVWSYNFQEPHGFENHEASYILNNSREVKTCTDCHGAGRIVCDSCHGAGNVTCYSCDGVGHTRCYSCDGTGRKRCSSCSGTGRVERTEYSNGRSYTTHEACSSCRGTGHTECWSCSGSGRITCSSCGGSGKVMCSTCTGTGKVECYTCQGKGQMVHFLYIHNVYTPLVDSFFKTEHSPVEITNIDANIAAEAGKLIFQHKEQELSESLLADMQYQPLRQTILEKLRNHVTNGKNKDATIIRRQELSLYHIPAFELTYTANGKNYKAWLHGNRLRLFSTENPITDFIGTLSNEAKQKHDNKLYPEALNKASEVLSMEFSDRQSRFIFLDAFAKIRNKLFRQYALPAVLVGEVLALILNKGSFANLLPILAFPIITVGISLLIAWIKLLRGLPDEVKLIRKYFKYEGAIAEWMTSGIIDQDKLRDIPHNIHFSRQLIALAEKHPRLINTLLPALAEIKDNETAEYVCKLLPTENLDTLMSAKEQISDGLQKLREIYNGYMQKTESDKKLIEANFSLDKLSALNPERDAENFDKKLASAKKTWAETAKDAIDTATTQHDQIQRQINSIPHVLVALKKQANLSNLKFLALFLERNASTKENMKSAFLEELNSAREAFNSIIAVYKDKNAQLLKFLDDFDEDVRCGAVIAINAIGDAKLSSGLFEHLTDPDAYVRRYTAIALSKLSPVDLLPRIIQLLPTETNTMVKVEMVRVLGDMKDKKGTSILIAVDDTSCHQEVLSALAKIADENAVDFMAQCLETASDQTTQKIVADHLLKMGVANPLVVNELVRHLIASNATLFNRICTVLHAMQQDEKTVLQSMDNAYSKTTAFSVKKKLLDGWQIFKTQASLMLIMTKLSDSDQNIQAHVLDLLAEVQMTSAIPTLIEFYPRQEHLRDKIIQALGQIIADKPVPTKPIAEAKHAGTDESAADTDSLPDTDDASNDLDDEENL